jgi:hypothetical protein
LLGKPPVQCPCPHALSPESAKFQLAADSRQKCELDLASSSPTDDKSIECPRPSPTRSLCTARGCLVPRAAAQFLGSQWKVRPFRSRFC